MNSVINGRFLPYLLISITCSLVFIPFIGNCPLFDWDEVNFAECAREMVVSGDYSHVQINFRPFWEKPPIFIWLQAASMNVFGINEFAARFPNALCSILTLCTIFYAGRKFYSSRIAITWCAFYVCSLLPHFYFKTGIIDPWFNLFTFISLLQLHLMWSGNRKFLHAFISGLFLGLAVLTKGPAALLIAALSITGFLFYTRNPGKLLKADFLLFTFSTIFVSASWFIMEWIKGNSALILEFIDYQVRLFETKDAGHGGPFYYHILVLFFGCFPASLFFVHAVSDKKVVLKNDAFRLLMLFLFLSVLIIFSVVKTKIVHYSSLCYFPMTLLAALSFEDTQAFKFRRWNKVLFWLCAGTLFIAAFATGLGKFIIPYLNKHQLIKDTFAAENFNAPVSWTGWEFLPAILFLAGALLTFNSIRLKSQKLLLAGLLVNMIFVSSAINVFAPKAELYTQHTAIEFYKSCADRNCHLETHGFKSYAYLFYSNRLPADFNGIAQNRFIDAQLDLMASEGHSRIKSFATANQLWMEYGEVDRPAYIVARKPDETFINKLPGMHKLYDMNGYSFFVRMPSEPVK